MANYDFSTLNDRDLEELTRDLLSKKLNVNFQSFKPGPDKGIDLRYSTLNDENEIIVFNIGGYSKPTVSITDKHNLG